MISVDEFLAEQGITKLDILKIDAEGNDMQVALTCSYMLLFDSRPCYYLTVQFGRLLPVYCLLACLLAY